MDFGTMTVQLNKSALLKLAGDSKDTDSTLIGSKSAL